MLFVRQTRHRMWAAARGPDCGGYPGYGAMCPPRPRRLVTLPLPASPSSCPATESCFVTCGRRKGWKLEVLLSANICIMFRNYGACRTNYRNKAVDLSFVEDEITESHTAVQCIVSLFVRHRSRRSWRVMSTTHFVPTESCRPVNICANQIIYWAR